MEEGREVSNVIGFGVNEMKTPFKHAVEEDTRQNKVSKTESTEVQTGREMARNKPSSTKKFINKFNCVVNTDVIASGGYDELEEDVYSKRNDMEQKNPIVIEKENDSSESQLKFMNASIQSNSSEGKTVAIERTEAVPPDLILTTPGPFKSNVEATKLKMDSAISKVSTKVRDIVEEQNIRSGVVHIDNQETPVGKEVFRQKQKKSNIQPYSSDSSEPIRGPLPSSRDFTRQEKVFKKLQRSCKSIDEIFKDNSVVDLDEIDDLKNTLDEANVLLAEYQSKLKVLEEKVTKSYDKQKLCALKSKLKEVKDDIQNFRGLKRDSKFIQLCTILSNFYLDINNVYNKFEPGNGRKELLREVDICIKDLEIKATRNEETLFEILTEQVKSIGNKHLSSINK
ncbi:uncharacterized protein [Leptinotarsa decemlineata]|uniref:uncharacterized protein n=1 Tax=Leptinotarsa decemlineata TaxID=7539 RepID=UPI003D3075C5